MAIEETYNPLPRSVWLSYQDELSVLADSLRQEPFLLSSACYIYIMSTAYRRVWNLVYMQE